MPLDARFIQTVEELRVAIMGSEMLAPLLYAMIRFTRPRRVLEVGAGYTTPFIAQALADNAADYQREITPLKAKSQEFLDTVGRDAVPDPQQQQRWIRNEPALASPNFYTLAYKPVFVAVDSLAVFSSSASRVSGVLDELDLCQFVTLMNGDFRNLRDQISQQCAPIDFAWVDCNQCLAFFEQYWQCINPADGILIFHWLLTDNNGESVLEYLKSKQRIRNDFEIVSLWEPHKMAQNSMTIIRKTARKNPVFGDGVELMRDIEGLLKSNPVR